MEKKKYYVNIGTQEISQIPYGTNAEFVIYANDEEIFLLREKFNEIRDADLSSYVRAHIPFIPYHNDPQNDDYDSGIKGAYQMIYNLADSATKTAMDDANIGKEI
ncbi:hydrolase [Gracilibacillus oryzae]|uniref:Hydrolase n=1 Tax=Gracilibacillus oryzae TaxID=1672701 RepID=A0A7C8GS80_9BACI|nr:hydrolase [Gracilibacillus oryzae]KAB8131475.1 hydrolase [Gracilibacillus oryzae]